MEYVQQVLVQIAADKLGDARVLLDDLEAHRRELRSMRGFKVMSITRAIEAGGITLVSVETRWQDAATLDAYEHGARNAEAIARSHGNLTVSDGIRTRRMEAVGTDADAKGRTVYERWISAAVVPGAIVAIGLAVIYALSRIYLEMGSDGATPLAVIVAGGILLVAWYFAANPQVPQWQMAGIAGMAAAALIGGTIAAQVMDDGEAAEPAVVEPTQEPGGTPAAPGEVLLEMHDNVFVLSGAENPTLTAPAGKETVIKLNNAGKALHNIHVAVNGYDSAFCAAGGEDPCSDPVRIPGGQQGTITFTLPAGTYDYRCDFHTAEMTGTIEVQ